MAVPAAAHAAKSPGADQSGLLQALSDLESAKRRLDALLKT